MFESRLGPFILLFFYYFVFLFLTFLISSSWNLLDKSDYFLSISVFQNSVYLDHSDSSDFMSVLQSK